MPQTSSHAEKLRRPVLVWLGRGAILGALLFNGGWLIAGLLQGAPYSPALHDISDLGAKTAAWPWVMLIPQAVAGVLTIAFALGGLRPTLKVTGRGEPLGAWLVAMSLMGLDNVSDFFFRLDCLAAEAGCTMTAATASLQGSLHLGFGIATAVLTAAAPFVLARRMRMIPAWRRLAPGAIGFGICFTVLLAAYIGLDGRYGQGYAQRTMGILVAVGMVILARRVIQIGKGLVAAGA